MTRQIVRLDSNNTQQSINLEFDAEILSVINPTAQSIGISVGGNIPPQTVQSADIWIPADSGINYPVVGRNFAAAFMPPLLVNAPSGIPTAANLFFTAQEAVPNFGAFPLSTLATQALADVVLVPASSLAQNQSILLSVPISPDIMAVSVVFSASHSAGCGAKIVGQTTGATYLNAVTSPLSDELVFTVRVFASLDSVLQVTPFTGAFGAGLESYTVVGHRYDVPGPLNIRGVPFVAIDNSAQGVAPGNPTWGKAPTYSAYQLQLNPTVLQSIATISGIPNGVYRIEWDISCESPTGAASKKAYLIDTTNNISLAAVPFPGSRSGVITAYGPGAAFALAIQNGIAITDGSYLLGAIRVWKL